MVYDWTDRRDACYRMYIQERKSLEEIMAHMRETENFTPSKRAYQTQFKRWGFPSKQNPAHRNPSLVERVKELWETNTTQRDMLKVLIEEGFEIKERELMRVRAKNRWLLRVPNGTKATGGPQVLLSDTVKQNTLDTPAPVHGILEAAAGSDEVQQPEEPAQPPDISAELEPEIIKKRKERLERLQAESDERWAAKKRRRRTRGWAGLPADPPGPPRFPSETTIDESRDFLRLDNQSYRELRDHFQRVCEDTAIIKKTLAGPEKWQAAKDRLISESPHLQSVFWTTSTRLDAKALALDVICTDVTKRMRTRDRQMTIGEAKNLLGVNPEESRQIRNAFYATLKADHFTSKLEAGDAHWQELKDKWVQDTPLMQSILAGGEANPEHQEKLKAMEVICRDVMKRLRDDQTRRDPTRNAKISPKGPNSSLDTTNGASSTRKAIGHHAREVTSRPTQSNTRMRSLASKALATTVMEVDDLQIDPSLLEAANDPSFAADAEFLPALLGMAAVAPVPVYIRPHPQSEMHRTSKMWLGSLATRTVGELKDLLASKWPDATITRIDGTERDATGHEIPYLIEEDEELDAYLTHVQDRKAVIVVLLSRR